MLKLPYSCWLVGVVVLCVFFTGCSKLSLGYRYSVAGSHVSDQLEGPYMPTEVISPTEVRANLYDGRQHKEVVLVLRGVVSPSDRRLRDEAEKWLDYKILCYRDEGFYILKNTLLDADCARMTGVVLYPLQRSVYHNARSGETETVVHRYGVLQCSALASGILLHMKEDTHYPWDRDFAHFQRSAQRDRLGCWNTQNEEH